MARRGSETRKRPKSILVRVSDADYRAVSERASQVGITRADYLRRRIRDAFDPTATVEAGGEVVRLSEADRILLAGASRTMGHLAGLMKRAVFEMPASARGADTRGILEGHHADLQSLQAALRDVLDKFS